MMTIYELKVALCLAAFYLVWKVLLSRETLHRLNRVALLVVTILAFVLPLVKFTISQPTPMGEGMVVLGDLIALPEVAVQPVPNGKVFGTRMAMRSTSCQATFLLTVSSGISSSASRTIMRMGLSS